ncbi:MAG: fibronectin type III domain-containing protein [Isosphaeraceae bacterium]
MSNQGLLSPVTPVRFRRRVTWSPAVAGPPPLAPAWSIVRDPSPLRRHVAGQIWSPRNQGETPVLWHWLPVVGRQPRRRGSVWFASGLAPPPATVPFATPTLPVRDQEPRRRRLAGFAKIVPFPPPGAFVPTPVWYHVYANTGAGDPINYQTPVATIEGTTWTSSPLSYPGDWKVGVRAFYYPNGLEEQNLDCAVEIILDSSGNDITNRPAPPTGLRAIAVKGGNIKVEWSYPNPATAAKTPTGFHVYDGIGSVSYTTPVATVSYASSIANVWTAVITGLSDGTTYSFGVRAFNAVAEEPNTATVTCTSDASGPGAVQGLMGVAV